MMQVSKEAKRTQEKMHLLEARINLLQRKQEAANQRIATHQHQASKQEVKYSDIRASMSALRSQLLNQKTKQIED